MPSYSNVVRGEILAINSSTNLFRLLTVGNSINSSSTSCTLHVLPILFWCGPLLWVVLIIAQETMCNNAKDTIIIRDTNWSLSNSNLFSHCSNGNKMKRWNNWCRAFFPKWLHLQFLILAYSWPRQKNNFFSGILEMITWGRKKKHPQRKEHHDFGPTTREHVRWSSTEDSPRYRPMFLFFFLFHDVRRISHV